MQYKLSINSSDFEFIKEAIKLRTVALVEDLEMQATCQVAENIASVGSCSAMSADTVIKAEGGPFSFATAPVKAEGAPVSFTVNATNKKPHWTQTAKGKKIMAARKRKGTK